MTAPIFFHCYWVGSTPVGLCAQACNRTIDPEIAFSKNLIIASKLNPLVLGSKYGYSTHFNPACSMIFLWLSHVGSEIYTNLGRYWLRNVNPRLRAPVPEMAWHVATLCYLIAGLSTPNKRFLAPVLNSARPSMGKYS